MEEKIESPCIGVCAMDPNTGFCQGCFRTVEEIQDWWDLSEESKMDIVSKLDARQSEGLNFD